MTEALSFCGDMIGDLLALDTPFGFSWGVLVIGIGFLFVLLATLRRFF